MRLLIVSQYFWPENFRINDLAAEFVRRGHHVTVLTGRPNYPSGIVFPEFRTDPARFAMYEGAQVLRVPHVARGHGSLRLILNYFSFALSASVLAPWLLRKQRFDAIFVFEISPVTVGFPAAVCRAVKKAPVAFWVLDLWPETLQAVGAVRSRALLRVIGAMVKYIYRRCDVILAQSRSFIPHIKKYAHSGQCPIEYFPSWSEPILSCDNAVAPAPEVPPKPGTFSVMFAGNIGVAQDFPAILDAAELLKAHDHIRWLVVGDGRMAPWVMKEIERREMQDRVLMLGRFPIERMPSFYRHANAVLVSLRDEPIFSMTIPGKLQSYLAAGVPVLAMINGEGAEVVQRAGAGLTCSAGDSRALAAAVLRMSSMSQSELAQLGRNGQALTRREFDRANLISQLEQFLSGLRYPKTARDSSS